MKHYYDCPLKAAFMAKYHGVKLQADSGMEDEGVLVDAGSRFIDCDDTLRELWEHDFSYLGRLYIHPDSLHLLEPQEGDICESSKDGVSELIYWRSPMPTEGVRIIQRNGIAFMWPEFDNG